jgi:hypothetical protein
MTWKKAALRSSISMHSAWSYIQSLSNCTFSAEEREKKVNRPAAITMMPITISPIPVLVWPLSRVKLPPATTMTAPINRAMPIIFFLLICFSPMNMLRLINLFTWPARADKSAVAHPKRSAMEFQLGYQTTKNPSYYRDRYTSDKRCTSEDILKSLLLFNSVEVCTRYRNILRIGGNF